MTRDSAAWESAPRVSHPAVVPSSSSAASVSRYQKQYYGPGAGGAGDWHTATPRPLARTHAARGAARAARCPPGLAATCRHYGHSGHSVHSQPHTQSVFGLLRGRRGAPASHAAARRLPHGPALGPNITSAHWPRSKHRTFALLLARSQRHRRPLGGLKLAY